MDESPRRRVLRTGTALLAGGLTVGLGGCLQRDDTDTPTDDGGDGGDDLPAYTDWLPAPDALNGQRYPITVIDVAAARDHAAVIEGTRFDGLTSSGVQYPGIEPDAFTRMVGVGQVQVLTGDFESDTFAGLLDDRALTEAGTAGDYTLYDGGAGAAALTTDVAVVTRNGSLADVRAVLDAKRGAADRFTAVDDDCRRLVTALGDATLVFGLPHPGPSGIDGVVAYGGAFTVAGERTTLDAPLVFENRGAAAVDAVETALADEDYFDPATSTSVTRRGRSVVVTASFPTDAVQSLSPPYLWADRQRRTPKVQFAYDYDHRGDDAGVLTIQHDGGDSIRAAELFLRGAGFLSADGIPDTAPADLDVSEPGAQWPNDAASGEIDDAPAVVGGDEVRIGVASDYEISVVWEPIDGDTSATLGDGAGPDA
ncbi:hypothetical protein ACOZ4N_13305 [Halorientalis pallida]|uniref:hypothetical protein n=1 Tax=Halorientalis pallida TaxID=2479928 RepID=UPI003C6F72FC